MPIDHSEITKRLEDLEAKLAILLPATSYRLSPDPCDICGLKWLYSERNRDYEVVFVQNCANEEEVVRPLKETPEYKFGCACLTSRNICYRCIKQCHECHKLFCKNDLHPISDDQSICTTCYWKTYP